MLHFKQLLQLAVIFAITSFLSNILTTNNLVMYQSLRNSPNSPNFWQICFYCRVGKMVNFELGYCEKINVIYLSRARDGENPNLPQGSELVTFAFCGFRASENLLISKGHVQSSVLQFSVSYLSRKQHIISSHNCKIDIFMLSTGRVLDQALLHSLMVAVLRRVVMWSQICTKRPVIFIPPLM